jgi:hypothetical protein
MGKYHVADWLIKTYEYVHDAVNWREWNVCVAFNPYDLPTQQLTEIDRWLKKQFNHVQNMGEMTENEYF